MLCFSVSSESRYYSFLNLNSVLLQRTLSFFIILHSVCWKISSNISQFIASRVFKTKAPTPNVPYLKSISSHWRKNLPFNDFKKFPNGLIIIYLKDIMYSDKSIGSHLEYLFKIPSSNKPILLMDDVSPRWLKYLLHVNNTRTRFSWLHFFKTRGFLQYDVSVIHSRWNCVICYSKLLFQTFSFSKKQCQ